MFAVASKDILQLDPFRTEDAVEGTSVQEDEYLQVSSMLLNWLHHCIKQERNQYAQTLRSAGLMGKVAKKKNN